MTRAAQVALLALAMSLAASVEAQQEFPPDDASGAWAADFADASPNNPGAAYNAGLRFAHEDRLGLALLQLERAHLLAPFDREIQDARFVVQREVRRRRIESAGSATVTEGEPAAVSWWRFFAVLPPGTYALLALVCTWLTVLLLVVRLRLRAGGLRDGVTIMAAIFAFVLLNTAVMWTGQVVVREQVDPAVVVASAPRFRDAPDELSRLRSDSNLYEGAVVVVSERRAGWLQLELVDGSYVWVQESVALPLER